MLPFRVQALLYSQLSVHGHEQRMHANFCITCDTHRIWFKQIMHK